MKILIIGGSRFVGPYVIDLLVKHGHEVTVFNRGTKEVKYPDSVTHVKGDRDKGFNLNQKFDVVIDMCAYIGKQVQQVIDQLKFGFLVHFGSIASYSATQVFPITEDFPLGNLPSTDNYGIGKSDCEKALQESGVKYATLRPAYVLGPENYCDRENFIYTKIFNKEPIMIPGNGQALNQFVFADEVANALVLLAEKKTEGAFNCVGNEYITLTGLVEMMGKVVGIEPVIKYNSLADGASFIESEFPFTNENWISSNDKIKELGINFVPLYEGLKRDYESYYKSHI